VDTIRLAMVYTCRRGGLSADAEAANAGGCSRFSLDTAQTQTYIQSTLFKRLNQYNPGGRK
jgi:hypothetical protein